MAKQLRVEFPGALYDLTARGNARESIYWDNGDRERFLAVLGHEIEQQGWRCYAYCLMDNHYLLVGDILSHQYAEAYQIAAWLLRRKANLPLGEVAEPFGVSASRISHIQRGLEGRQSSARELKVIALCNAKQ